MEDISITPSISNPKRLTNKNNGDEWYNYYAGFSDSFVREILKSLELPKEATILDPWNGSGTTTLNCALAGYNVIGIDLNPVMNIIAKSKFCDANDVFSALKIVKGLRVKCYPKHTLDKSDFLLHWFDFNTASYIRYISKFLQKKCKDISLSTVYSLIFLALFSLVRKYVGKFIASNPTWVKKSKLEDEKVSVNNNKIKSDLLDFINGKLSSTYIDKAATVGTEIFHCASSTNLPLENNSIDAIITSPPYCTRIDYGIATSPELGVLLGNFPKAIDELRRKLTGRTTIDKNEFKVNNVGPTANSILQEILEHDSHASSSYYYKNFAQYFIEIKNSLEQIKRVIKKHGYFVCVVQDSYYKEIYCDLATIFTEIAEANDLIFIHRQDFMSKFSMANINNKAKKYRDKMTANETVLVFQSK
ncbi:DNA methyltransferase [Rahnella sikkimica]|uniref:site-specific DNA-methyltransferase (cytosine-N(4)-specific) n=1 Tax=Rahnella sikkimica TaxID=1805933 RepID=A0A2L1UUP8_9GAMM|nr:DNA methyltransferase [Rahnella sikkimica]AVF36548.1 hypothetical protein BV494_17145 [Rahnella sikkimica]